MLIAPADRHTRAVAEITIIRGGLEHLDEVGPLWQALHEHHAAVTPPLARLPMRDSAESWHRRRVSYAKWLEEPGTLLLLARATSADTIGYAFVRERGPSEGWQTRERCAELETLSVRPDHRSRGVGSMLLDKIYAHLRTEGILELYVEVAEGNDDARRLYERRGFAPWIVTLVGTVPES
jgi:ribosomal protein S18 acetylase RimI-like enzyme